jgi:hypothetical protein
MYVPANILITGARVLYAPAGTAFPDDTLAFGAAWPSWTEVGYTLAPFQLSYRFDVVEVMTQQTNAPVKRRRRSETVSFQTSLGEHTAQNLALAMAGVASSTPAGVGQPGKEEFSVGGDASLPTQKWGAEGVYESDAGEKFPVRVFIHQGTASEGGDLGYDRENPTGIPLSIGVLADFAQPVGRQLFVVQRILAAATG